MPENNLWKNFFNPDEILYKLGLNDQIGDVVEFGCGYGTFTVPAAKLVSGKIYSLDIEPEMIRITAEEAKNRGITNIRTVLRDFVAQGSGLTDASVDYVMLFNILHLENPMILINEAKRILKTFGKLGIIHWNHDPATPRGPSLDIRPKPEDCIKWAKIAGFRDPKQFDLKPYHYGIVLQAV